jgi:pimeloyl-ACP methyl ester carboxylesterase
VWVNLVEYTSPCVSGAKLTIYLVTFLAMKTTVRTLLSSIALVCGLLAHSATADVFPVKIRPGSPGIPSVSVSIKTTVISNPNPGYGGITIMAVHGLAHTGNTMRPLAEELFDNPPNGVRVKKVILLNMPGRGGSGLPYGNISVKFGNLNVDDYAEVLLGALVRHDDDNVSVLVGHSMGGLIIQASQEHLLRKGKNLRNKFGITDVVLVASAYPSAVIDPFLESGAGLGLVAAYTTSSSSLGSFVSIDPDSFLNLFFTTDLNGGFAPGTPTVTGLATLGYKSDESLAASIQTAGTANLRPTVRANIFTCTTGTQAHMIVGIHDVFNDPVQIGMLYQYLTGDASLANVTIVETSDSVHDQYITNPAALVNAFNNP